MLRIELTDAIKSLKKMKAKKVLLQIPEGLKTNTENIVKELEQNGLIVITSMDPCFGACDIKPNEAELMKCDAVLHIGHTKFVEKNDKKIIYAPLNYKLTNLEEIKTKITHYLLDNNFSYIGIVTTAQYLHYLPELKKHLEKNKIKIEITNGKRVENGQVLGCNYSSANGKAKTILYFGDGLFHPLGIHFGTKKEVIIFDPILGTIKTLDKEKNNFLRKRFLLIEKAKEGKSFAILVSTKIGQNRISIAEKIKKELEAAGKKVFICSMDYISEEKLLGLEVDVLVNTACPRLSIDDFASYKKPLLNYNEVKYVLGKSYENYETEIIY